MKYENKIFENGDCIDHAIVTLETAKRIQGVLKSNRTPAYTEGVEWIALNDEPTCVDPAEIDGLISTLLVADLFGVEPAKVAADIVAFRQRQKTAAGFVQRDNSPRVVR